MQVGVYSRSLLPPPLRGGGHPSSPSVATGIKRPTRRQAGRLCLPIRSCTGWGLPCSRCLHRDGELLPRHFNLARLRRVEYFLWHFPSGRPALPLAGILPGGARTFLPPDCIGTAAARPPHIQMIPAQTCSAQRPVMRSESNQARGVKSISVAPTSSLLIIAESASRANSTSSPAAWRRSSPLSG